MAKSAVNELRNLVRARQRAANQKVSRYKKQGVNIAGSAADPRIDLKRVDKMNTRQLNAHLKRLNTFTDRTTQFVRGAKGVPIDRGLFQAYKAVETNYNNHFKKQFEKVRDVQLPGRGLTIGERHDMVVPKAKSLRAGTSKYFGKDRVSSGFTSDKAVKDSIRHLKKSTRPGFSTTEEVKRRVNFNKLIRYAGRDDLMKAVESLTNEEFYILWEYDSLIQNVVEEYYITIELLGDEDNAIEHSGGNDLFDEILQTVTEVKSKKSLRGRLRNNNKRR